MSQPDIRLLEKLAKLIRYYILVMTTNAGSGHPTSSLSAVELMTALMFGNMFRFDLDNPGHPNNDRLIFSKGHASPLFYSLWAAAGRLTEKEIMTYRQFGSPLEGHPTVAFPYTEAATGSLGQGLAIGLGMALNAKLDKLPYRTYVLLGDSEMAEGSQWEGIQLAAHYRLDNLTGIIDVNRLGQRGETMYGHDLAAYKTRISGFGWRTITVDGHDFREILQAYAAAENEPDQPVMIIARTIKGKGVSLFEDKNGWHGKPLPKKDLGQALDELGEIDKSVIGTIRKPENQHPSARTVTDIEGPKYDSSSEVATRNAYGKALKRIYPKYPAIVGLDAEVSNSTKAELLKKSWPDRFFEMYIAEQNMAGTALGFARRGKIPFVSTFSAFMSRAYDQIRMSQYSDANIKYVGSHAGVSIGQDGPSQMGLEDIAFFRTLLDSVVLYPCDAVSTEKLVEEAAQYRGIVYLRTTRGATPVIYGPEESFPIGGCKVLSQGNNDAITLISAGITLHEVLAARDILAAENIIARVIDLYSIKPIDTRTLQKAAAETDIILTVEDHFPEGGLGEAVRSALWDTGFKVASLAVRKKPKSGRPAELLDFEEISRQAIVRHARELLK